MKKMLIIPIIFVIICFMSCEEPKETNPFVGTWEDRTEEITETFIFTKDLTFTRTVVSTNILYNENNTGLYEYNDTTLYLDYKTPNMASIKTEYSFIESKLRITFSPIKTFTYVKIN